MRVVVVTGAGGDIGREICLAFAQQGMAVAGWDISEARLSALAREMDGSPFLPLQVDVRHMDSVLEAAARVNQKFGDVNILVNNAGGITKPSLRTTEEADWLTDIDLNLNAPWRCIRAVQDSLIHGRASVIVNIASVNGLGIFGHPGYSAAKAGLIHLTRFCSTEFGKYGLRSIAICPGSVKTRAWHERQANNPSILETATSWYPSRDICTTEAVARLVTYVAGEESLVLNGAVITLDGGLTAGSDRLASLFAGEAL